MAQQTASSPLRSTENTALSLSLPKGPWTKQLKDFPAHFSEAHITAHEERHKAQKHTVAGYRMFKAEKVRSVILCKADCKIWVKATVEASFLLSKNYVCGALLRTDGSIEKATCQCCAGSLGACKHVVAVFWFLLDAVRSGEHYIRDPKSCTEKPRTWGTGARRSKVKVTRFSDLQFVKHDPKKRQFQGDMKTEDRAPSLHVQQQDLRTLKEQLEQHNICPMLTEILESADCMPVVKTACLTTTATVPETKDLPISLPKSVLWADQLPSDYDFGGCALTLEEAHELEKNTRQQSSSVIWLFERKKRLTASHFGDVVSRKAAVNEKFVKRVFTNTSFTNKYMAEGISNEESAVQRYVQKLEGVVLMYNCGLCVNPGVPMLRASPDRVVMECDTGEHGLVEVKTLAAAKENRFSPEESFQAAAYLKDGKLRPSHKYYYQVQGQLAITGLEWCDFVVDNGGECTVE